MKKEKIKVKNKVGNKGGTDKKMSKKLIRLTAFLLAAALTGGVLAGCGGDRKKGGTASFKMIIPDWNSIYDGINAENNMVYDAIQEKYKADTGDDFAGKFVWYPGVSYATQVNMTVGNASSDVDAFSMYGTAFMDYVTQPGLLMDIGALIDEHGKHLKAKIPARNWDTVTYKGKIYGIPDVIPYANDTAFIRMDVLKAAGITKVPETLAELEAAFEVFKGQGMIAWRAPSWQTQKWLLGSFGIPYYDYLDGSGNFHVMQEHPNFEAYVGTLQRWRVNGWMPPDFDNVTWQQNWLDFISGKQGIAIGWYSTMERNLPLLREVVPAAEVAHLNAIKVSGTAGGYAPDRIVSNMVHIFANSKNAAAVIQYLDWMMSDRENMLLTWRGLQGTHYDYSKAANTVTPKEKYLDPAVKGYTGAYSLCMDYVVFGAADYPDYIFTKQTYKDAFAITKAARAELDGLDMLLSASQEYNVQVDIPEVGTQAANLSIDLNYIVADYIMNKSSTSGFNTAIADKAALCKTKSIPQVGNKNYYEWMQAQVDAKR